jgi:DNA-directed RNA polymerase subunit RPC12/RpoP
MINFIQNDRRRLLIVGATALVALAGAAYSVWTFSSTPQPPQHQNHYTCDSCGYKWLDSSSDPPQKCPKCGGAAFATFWGKCAKCGKYSKIVEIKILSNNDFEWRLPAGQWGKAPVRSSACPYCDSTHVGHANPTEIEGWDPPAQEAPPAPRPRAPQPPGS